MSSSSSHRQLVRVRVGNNEATVTAGYAAEMNLVPLDKPAVDRYGNSLPAKHVTDLANEPVPAGRGSKHDKEN